MTMNRNYILDSQKIFESVTENNRRVSVSSIPSPSPVPSTYSYFMVILPSYCKLQINPGAR